MRFPMKQTLAVAKHIGRQKRRGIKRFPLVLMLEPLHACNLTCTGCGRIREYKDNIKDMLPLEKCLAAVDDCEAPVVSVCGGEPLLYPEIQELVAKILELGKVVYLCTNGQVLDKKLDLFQPHKMFNINIHLDGLAKTHDMIVEKDGAFDKAVAGIKLAKDAGFIVCSNTTVYKQTNTNEIRELVKYLDGIGVDGFLMSPGFDYSDVEDQSVFLTKDAIIEKFNELDDVTSGPKIWNTPLFYDFLKGNRDYPCTPWGNVTYNIRGWKAPCYLVTDKHYESYDNFIKDVAWEKYGPGCDPRCTNCMAHCGFEATVALTSTSKLSDMLRMAKWTLL